MEQRTLVSGFSELKALLIRTYNIDRDPSLVRLHFSENRKGDGELLMHDYNDHSKLISICFNIKRGAIPNTVRGSARSLVEKSLESKSPVDFLKLNFRLYGFFRF